MKKLSAASRRIEIDGTLGTLRWEMERVSELILTEPRKGRRTISVVAPEHPSPVAATEH